MLSHWTTFGIQGAIALGTIGGAWAVMKYRVKHLEGEVEKKLAIGEFMAMHQGCQRTTCNKMDNIQKEVTGLTNEVKTATEKLEGKIDINRKVLSDHYTEMSVSLGRLSTSVEHLKEALDRIRGRRDTAEN